MQVHSRIIRSFPKLLEFQKSLPGGKSKWIFRGEQFRGGIKNSLKTSLEEAFDNIRPSIKKNKLKEHKVNSEKDIIREFQRKLHLYSNNLPTRADIIQWLSLMQHYGAPTRLLDWTYSFWVAVHFAVTKSRPGKNAQVAIWTVDARKLVDENDKFKKKEEIKEYIEEIKTKQLLPYCDQDSVIDNAVVHYLIENPTSRIYASSSFRRNERLTLQQGTFLISGDIRKSFQANLKKIGSLNDKNLVRVGIIKLTHQLKERIVKKLWDMNINNAVLFPGIGGFSESLWRRIPLRMGDKTFLNNNELSLFPWSIIKL